MHQATQIVLTAHGSSPCALSGFPVAVHLLDAAGAQVDEYHVALTDSGYITTSPNRGVALAPGTPDGATGAEAAPGQAFLLLKTFALMCGHAAIRSVAVVLADGRAFTLPIGFGPASSGCVAGTADVAVSSFQTPTLPPLPPLYRPDLTVAYSAPATLQLGATMAYSVTLTNVGDHPLVFNPCPGYTESLKGFAGVERHLLNCAAMPTLAAGASRTLAMEMRVPPTPAFPLRDTSLSWSVDLPFQSQNVAAPATIAVR